MNKDVFLVDNNVLSRLSRSQRASRFLRERCFVTRDVLYEARGFADEISDVPVREVTIAVLERLKQVMTELPWEDTSVVNLYDNKGSADPALVATALVMVEEEAETLFPSNIILVTDDKAVIKVAGNLGVARLSYTAFSDLVSA